MKKILLTTPLFILLMITSALLHAANPLAHVFTTDIYSQTELADDASEEDKIKELKRLKLSALQTQKLDAIEAEITSKEKIVLELREKEDLPIVVCTLANTALLVAAGPVGIGATLAIKYAFDRPQNFEDALEKGFTTLYAPALKTVRAIAPREEYEAEVKKLKNDKTALQKAATEGSLFDLESLYVKNKQKFPQNWQTKIEDLLIDVYKNDHDETLWWLVYDLVWQPWDVKTFSKDERNKLIKSLPIGLTKSLLTNLTDTKKRHCGYCQTNNQDAFQKELEEIAETLGLPLLVIDALEHDPCPTFLYGLPSGTDRSKIDTETFVEHHHKGLFLSALNSPHKGINNCILLIKNIDQWTKPGDVNLAWILKLFDKEAKTFHSDYFGLDVDWSRLNVFGSGTTPKDKLDAAFKSRAAGYFIR